MLTDPGYIPLNYSYDPDKLPTQYRNLVLPEVKVVSHSVT